MYAHKTHIRGLTPGCSSNVLSYLGVTPFAGISNQRFTNHYVRPKTPLFTL